MYGFKFNGVESSTHGVIMKSKNRQALPEINDSFVQIPGRHGSYLYSGEFSDREITLECGLVHNSLESLRSKLREVAAWLHTTERKALVFDDEPGKTYKAKLTGSIDPEQVAKTGKFDLTFRCEPFAYGEEKTDNFVSDAVTVENAGTVDTEPYFQTTFTAETSEWKVTLGTDYCRLIHSFQIGDVLTLDFKTGAVMLNGVRAMDLLDWQNSRFFTLPPGESTLTVTPAGRSVTLVKHTPKWL